MNQRIKILMILGYYFMRNNRARTNEKYRGNENIKRLGRINLNKRVKSAYCYDPAHSGRNSTN